MTSVPKDTPPHTALTARQVSIDDPAAEPLVAGLRAEYLRRYDDESEMDTYDDAEFTPPRGLLLIAELDGATVAGGGLRLTDPGSAELKRMWTHPDHRGRGLARWMLSLVEREAARLGYRRLRLETGLAQPEAIALYRSTGYLDTEPFGHWAADPLSVYLAKDLP